MRKPVQLATGAIGEPYGDEKNDTETIGHTIYALCDDGSIWRLYNDGWIRLDDIPQDEPEQPKETPKPEETLRVAEQKPKVQPPAPKPKPAPDKAAPQKVQPSRLKDAVPGPRNQEGHPQGSPDGGIAGGVPGGVPGGRAGGMDGGVAGGVPASTRNMALSRILSAVEKHKNYPKHARRSGAEGLVILLVSVNDQGRITASTLDKHCGQAALDTATKELGEKLMGLNTGVQGAAFSVRVPVEYKLK